jgi:hypothetical protein
MVLLGVEDHIYRRSLFVRAYAAFVFVCGSEPCFPLSAGYLIPNINSIFLQTYIHEPKCRESFSDVLIFYADHKFV